MIGNLLTYSSGIDESNTKDQIVLWPQDLQATTNSIRNHLTQKHGIKRVGVIITDMAAIPLQKGIIAGPVAYSGFQPYKDITGTKDIFGRTFKFTWEGHLQGLAAAAGVVMGEGAQQTPIGVITDIPFIKFQPRNPTKKELTNLKMSLDADMFAPLIKSANWKKGGNINQ
jgi:F420-0:gamma-glutamyl ligase